MHCCSGYCNKPSAASVYGKCGGGGGGGGQESYEVQFWPHANHAGSGLVYTGTGEHDLGVCRGFGAGFEHLNDAVSSIKWSDNVVLVVYDAYNCGGNNHVIYSSGPHETMNTEFGKTRAQGFLAGYENDLATVCMRTRCGYTSSSQMRSHSVGGSVGGTFFVSAEVNYAHTWGTEESQAWNGCECERSWNDEIRSYRIFRREVQTSRSVR
ncbi:hypothetical protein ONE63_003554 [Megalurothrips usitatus]|uniref:Uncharacterized protein n=1 Tax=Megalurothrips usitatus TaxID=439358 RepID=A0AAV7X794_9NEOP|nr:hypothetical protein ONE63_003554 [Megalurothrips usitatus]